MEGYSSERGSFGLLLSRRSPVSKQLIAFLIDVSVNLQTREEFKRDPASVLEKSGLSQAEREAVMSGDPERIRIAAAVSAAGGMNQTRVEG